jgi:hypothetical protein
MRRRSPLPIVALLLLFCKGFCNAQSPPITLGAVSAFDPALANLIAYVATAPSGSCTVGAPGSFEIVVSTLAQWSCQGASIGASGTWTPIGSVPGANTQIVYNANGIFGANAGLTWSPTAPLTSVTGFTSTANSYNGFTSLTDGAFLRGYTLNQNAAGTNGGYIDIQPIAYNPYDSGTVCKDIYGNDVQQPIPVNGQTFGPNDIVVWSGTSPLMPSNGSCGVPLPVVGITSGPGLNLNTYVFARGGFSSDLSSYATIELFTGGVQAGSITALSFYPAGTPTTTGPLPIGAYRGGYMITGHSAGPPAPGTIATVTNPLSGGEGLIQGMFYYDDALGCFNGLYGSGPLPPNGIAPTLTWQCLGSGGGGGSVNSVSGTANQIVASPTSGNVILSLPAIVQTNEFSAGNTGTNLVFNSNGFQVNGNGIVNQTTSGGAIIAAGYVDTAVWYGMLPTNTAPSITPGGGYSAFTYRGGSDGNHIWLYNTMTSTWNDIDLGATGTGISSLNSQTGPSITIAATTPLVATTTSNTVTLTCPTCSGGIGSVSGTTNQIAASTTSGAVTLSLPAVTGTSEFVSSATGSSIGFALNNSNYLVDGNGDVTFSGTLHGAGGYLLVDTSHNGTFASVTTGPIIASSLAASGNVSGSSGVFGALNLSGITGSTQCLHVNSFGNVSGTGADCGSGGGGGVTTLTGTANQINVSAPTGAVTLSLPSTVDIAGAFDSAATGLNYGLIVNGGQVLINGQGDISGAGAINMAGITGGGAYRVGGTTIVDNSRNLLNIVNLTMTGTVVTTGLVIGADIISNGNIAAVGYYQSGTSIGVNCSGAPTSLFQSVGGIVIHC